MPGKKQLQKFSDNVLKLGDEVKVRASRGEKPAVFPIPPETPDVDDSQDFVLGMPDPEDESLAVPNTPDSEESAGIDSGDSDLGIPDIPIPGAESFSGQSDIPDLDDILNSIAGANTEPSDIPDLGSLGIDNLDNSASPDVSASNGTVTPADIPDITADTPAGMTDTAADTTGIPAGEADKLDIPDIPADIPSGIADIPSADTRDTVGSVDDFDLEPVEELNDFDLEPAADAANPEPVSTDSATEAPVADETISVEPVLTEPDAIEPVSIEMDTPETVMDGSAAVESGETESLSPESAISEGVLSDNSLSDSAPAEEPVESGELSLEEPAAGNTTDVFGGDFGLDLGDLGSADSSIDSSDSSDSSTSSTSPESSGGIDLENFDIDDIASDFSSDGGAEPQDNVESPQASPLDNDIAAGDGGIAGDEGISDESISSEGEVDPLGSVDLSALDAMDFDSSSGSQESDFGDSEGSDSSASFDDIDIKDTDENLGGTSSGDDFELGGEDDFLIPGFSDTLEADFSQASQKEVNPVALGQSASAANSVVKDNSLTEEDYEKFKKNLSRYPLNVKIAIEEMIANNDFTEDVIFEVIEKVIKKTPARQLAIYLEKILDISLPVPRDFEHRTVEEYEAYKASFEYQLKNKIIPLVIITIGMGLISTFLFMCGKFYIYRPLKADSLYRQGYALLQSEEFPQSEQKFKEAVRYRNSKKWFYKYARGYREHKQYERAAILYDDILKRFNNDKAAGLEYAEMEWQDLANYEGAVRLLNDRMLMYHVNDADGILELGDIYLDWADNGEIDMYENARLNYASLLTLYGQKDLYLSRMMRYFIRTDNLREVLRLKEIFFPKKKALESQDLTELSGYMFDKMTGKLAPDEAYLKDRIEDVKALMERAIEADSTNPTALYNMARYYINMSNINGAISYLDAAIDAFKKAQRLRKADVYRQIDSYRLKGEIFVRQKEIIKAVETFTDGISTFKAQTPALPGNHIVGKLYSDMADIDYFNFNNTDSAYEYYRAAIENDNDTPSIRYKVGAIQYEKGAFQEAMGSFMATAESVPDDNNLLMALGNVLINRNSYSAAKGYYERLVNNLDVIKANHGILMPQVDIRDQQVVEMYMKAANNLGVTQYHLAKRTGNSNLNAQSIINFTESLRAWDALTRNQETMKRLPGTNLAHENIQYVLKPSSNFEPAVYPDIPRTLSGEEKNRK